jgi:hypothetical protein
MTFEERFINPIERSLLTDLVDLYNCDLSTEEHLPVHELCLACSKEAIVKAILAYQSLDALVRAKQEQEQVPPRPP